VVKIRRKDNITLEARPGVAGEVISTDHGDMTVQEGGYVVTHPDGRSWPVDKEYFEQNYDVLDGSYEGWLHRTRRVIRELVNECKEWSKLGRLNGRSEVKAKDVGANCPMLGGAEVTLCQRHLEDARMRLGMALREDGFVEPLPD
jgi:hypothetical protein